MRSALTLYCRQVLAQMHIMKKQKRAYLRPQTTDAPAAASNENPLAHQYINLVSHLACQSMWCNLMLCCLFACRSPVDVCGQGAGCAGWLVSDRMTRTRSLAALTASLVP